MISGASSVISFIGVTLALFAYGIPPGARANESSRLDPGAGGLVEINQQETLPDLPMVLWRTAPQGEVAIDTVVVEMRRMASSNEGPQSTVKPTFKCPLNGVGERP